MRRRRQGILNAPRNQTADGLREIAWGLAPIVLLGSSALRSKRQQSGQEEDSGNAS